MVFLLVSLPLSLGGCAQQANPLLASEPSQSTEATPSESARPASDFSIPEDFPSDIPIHQGEIVLGSATGPASARTWAVEVLVDDLVAARANVLRQLGAAGFTLGDETGIGTETYEATMSRSDYQVRLKVYLEDETGEREIRYVVTTN